MGGTKRGLLVLHKPPGISSHATVQRARRVLGAEKAGHAGTLDPLASGVLLVGLGQGTRLLEFLVGHDKEYRATVRLGELRDTLDREGRLLETRPVPPLTTDQLERALAGLRGRIRQVPPVYSAIKMAGQPLYRRARRGEVATPETRTVEIHRLDMVSLEPPDVVLELTCSKGTYVRSLARDLGQALGTGATLWELVRTRSGSYGLQEAVPLERLQAAGASAWEWVLPVERMVEALPRVTLASAEVADLITGRDLPWDDRFGEMDRLALFNAEGHLVAIGGRRGDRLHPDKVLQQAP